MKNKQFEIHKDDIIEFAEKLEELDLENRITGADDDDEMINVTVFYSREEKEDMEALIELVKDFELVDENDE